MNVQGVSKSRFFMWRTLFAVAHADDIVTDEELGFMAYVLDDVQFSAEQTETLRDDLKTPKDVEKMFAGISAQEDRVQFFNFARDLVWVDGDFGSEEQSVMIKLQKTHYENVDMNDLIGNVSLQFEDDVQQIRSEAKQPPRKNGVNFRNVIHSFHRRFMRLFK